MVFKVEKTKDYDHNRLEAIWWARLFSLCPPYIWTHSVLQALLK
jgi:hypothetical protein